MLAPLFLCSFYARLSECSKNAVRSMGRYDVVANTDVNFLQSFFQERFIALSPSSRIQAYKALEGHS